MLDTSNPKRELTRASMKVPPKRKGNLVACIVVYASLSQPQ